MNSHNVIKWVYAKTTINSFGFDRVENQLAWTQEINNQLLNENPGLSVVEIGTKMIELWKNNFDEIKLTEEEEIFVSQHFVDVSITIENHSKYSPLKYTFSPKDEEYILSKFNKLKQVL